MRRVTRNFVLGILVVLVLLLALGALPSLLASGDPYYLVAEPVANDSTNATVNVSQLSERRFPYTTAALDDGRSEAYYDGPIGLKEAFTHSPFDELSELEARNASAVTDETAYVRAGNTTYRLELIREPADAAGSNGTGTGTTTATPGTTTTAAVAEVRR
nr:hypothetical protein [Halomarina rubra]